MHTRTLRSAGRIFFLLIVAAATAAPNALS
jgi:hypothetical protein